MDSIDFDYTMVYDKPPIYDMPPVYDHLERVEKVSTLRSFLKSCLELMKDETVLNTLHEIIDQCAQDKETPIVQQEINQVHHKRR
jgi:hypothetical protein